MAHRVADGVWLLDLGLVPPFATNGYLVDDEGVTVVDPGLPVNRPSLRSELAEVGYGIDDVDRVLATHYDVDHVGGLRTFADAGELPVYIGAADLAIARDGAVPSRRHHKGLFHLGVRRLFPLPDGLKYRPVEEGQRIGTFTAYHTPGHNPGHVVYRHESGVAFLGDLVWAEEGALTPPFWLDSYDVAEIADSIRDLAARIPPFDVAAVAHGDPLLTGGHDALVACADGLSG